MASFVGTFDQFTRYIGPWARNKVNQISKLYRKKVGACQECGCSENLEAAHVKGRERPVIIEEILVNFTNDTVVTIDLDVFESAFIKAHNPVGDIIRILCKTCHVEYDRANNIHTPDVLDLNVSEAAEVLRPTNGEITDYFRENVPKLSEEVLLNLQSLEYCRDTFGLRYEVLKPIGNDLTIEEIRDAARVNGYARWSTNYIQGRNSRFLVTTQWYDRNRAPFIAWRDSL